MYYSARQFAQALTDVLLFDSNQQRADVSDALRRTAGVLNNSAIRGALTAPHMTRDQQIMVAQTIVGAVYKGTHEIITALSDLLIVLAEQRSLNLIQSIARLIDIPDRPRIRVANHRDEGLLDPLKDRYRIPEAEITVTEDPQLIGGFVLAKGDNILNSSVENALTRIHQAMRKTV